MRILKITNKSKSYIQTNLSLVQINIFQKEFLTFWSFHLVIKIFCLKIKIVLAKRMDLLIILQKILKKINIEFQNSYIFGKENFQMTIFKKNLCLNFSRILNCQPKRIGKIFSVSIMIQLILIYNLDLIKEMMKDNRGK